ncbi:tripartite tricarboxylate transporter TctB family protein [Oceanobacillus halophilus]|uniref:Tripartite tricarboxylate transporter TctB family protein n=1 Tax=Oceanobacillus halophilus TaxID=930130 RepID=A0A495A7N1_9BACI|nr:tripartite tricarboxylate transporter TctB family protein [Oceanobacillus halophilus]RKQ35739.1 tripartite tricarboxylate transporter TctB family protein [Oceanobacillus halophilus]
MNNYFKIKETHIYGLIALFGLLLVLVLIPMEIQSGEPRLMPYVYAAGLLIVSMFKFVSLFFNKKTEFFKFNRKVFKYVGLNILIYTAYIFLIQKIGFFVMSILFIIALLRVLGEGWKITLTLSVMLPASIYILFTQILALYFPSGILF